MIFINMGIFSIYNELIKEDASYVTTDKGTFDDADRKTYPFYYYYDTLYVGNEGGSHIQIGLDYNLVDDCLPDDPTEEEEAEAEENNWEECREIAGDMTVQGDTDYNGRVFLIPKVIAFWNDITKDELKMIVSDLNKEMGFGIDDTWQIKYMDNNQNDVYKKIGDYLGYTANNDTIRKLKQLAIDHVKGKKDRAGKAKIKLNPVGSDLGKIKQLLRKHPELQKQVTFENTLIMGVILESIIDEEMLNIGDLPNGVGLFIHEFNQGFVLSLYDAQQQKVYAMMNTMVGDSGYHITAVAAEKGFGPLIYEMGLQHVGKKNTTLQPDISGGVQDKAMDIWVNFYNRPDVEKETLEPSDYEFSYTILGELHPSDPNYEEMDYDKKTYTWFNLPKVFGVDQNIGEEILLAFNSIYWMEPTTTYSKLTQHANQLLSNGLNSSEPFDKGTEYWEKRY